MELEDSFGDLMKKVIIRTTYFVANDILCALANWIGNQLVLTVFQVSVILRILIALLLRLICGIWLKFLNVVPFQICEKDNYYEDPGVLEMQALLRGEDCFNSSLDQQQKLPFPPPDYNPYDKVYLAVYFFRLQRTIQNIHTSLLQSNSAVRRRIGNLNFFQRFIRYLSSRVAVNLN